MRTSAVVIVVWAFAAGASTGCSSGSSGTAQSCTPGTTQACVCPTGATGSQTCDKAGAGFGACQCVATDAGTGCPDGRPSCGGSCCATGAACVDDGTGTKTCAQSCTTSSQCPAAKGCCTQLVAGGAACLPNGVVAGQTCLCSKTTECASGCCAPQADASGNPAGPFVCKGKADGSAYGCCSTAKSCGGGYCCVSLTDVGNEVCVEPCRDDTQCGGGRCIAFTSGTCSGSPGGCEPR